MFLDILYIFAGFASGTIVLMLWSIAFRDALAHDPDDPSKFALFVQVPRYRSVVITRGGRPMHVLRGDEGPVWAHPESFLGWTALVIFFPIWLIWYGYKWYVMLTIGYHVFCPFFTGPWVYDLARYRVHKEGGKQVFTVVEAGTKGYRSNHVRTKMTNWYAIFSGMEIEKIPFTIKVAFQYEIIRSKEIEALFGTDSWNVLLDVASTSVVRMIVRRDMTLDMVISGTNNDLWAEPENKHDPYALVADLILQELKKFKTDDDVTLPDVALRITKVDVLDFEAEIPESELVQLRAAVFKKEEARGLELMGRAEAANVLRIGEAEAQKKKMIGKADAYAIRLKGTATAGAQEKLDKVHAAHPDIAPDIIRADAIRAFANQSGGLLDAVLSGFLMNRNGGEKKP